MAIYKPGCGSTRALELGEDRSHNNQSTQLQYINRRQLRKSGLDIGASQTICWNSMLKTSLDEIFLKCCCVSMHTYVHGNAILAFNSVHKEFNAVYFPSWLQC